MEFGIQVDTKLVIQAYSIRELAGHSAVGIKQHTGSNYFLFTTHTPCRCVVDVHNSLIRGREVTDQILRQIAPKGRGRGKRGGRGKKGD